MHAVFHPRLLVPALTALALVAGCSSAPPTEFRADVLEVAAADVLVLDVEGEERTVRLAGVAVPEPGECLADAAVEAVAERIEGEPDVEVSVVGKGRDGVELVEVDWFYDHDLATTLVEEGLAVADAAGDEIPAEMAEARNEAMRLGNGYFQEYQECTFATRYAEASKALTEAIERPVPTASSGTEGLVAALVVAIALAEATEEFAQQAHRDLRLLAYPPAQLAAMLAELSTRIGSARSRLRETRRLRTELRRVERRERTRLERQRERFWASERDRHSSPPSSGTDGSQESGASPGYTGPRCYEPGGKVWHPC